MSKCNLCCAWIAPDGTSTHLGPLGGSHHGVAYSLDDATGGRELEKKGYMHLSYGSAWVTIGEPTQAQLDRLFDIQQELIKRDSYRAETIEKYLTQQREKVTA